MLCLAILEFHFFNNFFCSQCCIIIISLKMLCAHMMTLKGK